MGADQFACLIRRRDEYPQDYFIHANNEINALANMQNVVVKWGVYVIRDKQVSVEQMCDRALLGAWRIKGQYNNYVAAYDDAPRNKLPREQAITDGMEAQAERASVSDLPAPKFQIKDDQLAGAEALVRWNHPQWGFQPPSEFIPLFERNGFITRLDQYVWDETCDAASVGSGGISADFDIRQVSRADIYNSDLIDFLTKTLKNMTCDLRGRIWKSRKARIPKIQARSSQRSSNRGNLGFVIEMDDFSAGILAEYA